MCAIGPAVIAEGGGSTTPRPSCPPIGCIVLPYPWSWSCGGGKAMCVGFSDGPSWCRMGVPEPPCGPCVEDGGADSGCGVGVTLAPVTDLSAWLCFFLASVSLRLFTAWRMEPLAHRAV